MLADTFSRFQPTYYCRGGRPYVDIFPNSLLLLRKIRSQDGRAVQGAVFRSQSTHVGVGSNPTPDTSPYLRCFFCYSESWETKFCTLNLGERYVQVWKENSGDQSQIWNKENN